MNVLPVVAKQNEVETPTQMNSSSCLIDSSQLLAPNDIERSSCEVCGSDSREDLMMLCGDALGNGCNKGIHLYCLQPPLLTLPADDWYYEGWGG